VDMAISPWATEIEPVITDPEPPSPEPSATGSTPLISGVHTSW
jgi:hypothetical protein